MSFLGFGKKKEEVKIAEPLPAPQMSPVTSAPVSASPLVDAAALLGSKASSDLSKPQDDFPFEHLTRSPLEEEPKATPIPEPTPQGMPLGSPVQAQHEELLEEAPAPMEESPMPEMANLSELSRQLPIQDIPRPPDHEMKEEDSFDLALDIPESLTLAQEKKEKLPEFSAQEFDEIVSPQEEIMPEPIVEHGRYDSPADMGSELMGSDRKVRRFKVTKINGELFVEAESYKFFLENMVTMHEDLRRTNALFLKYSTENIEEDKLYKKMFQQLNNIHEDLIKIDHQLFERG
ncbi:MAG TPA: hypothetical protein VJG90_07205 [Candidatus Nanoarchaeia archaeon]|nr:hypothetical protein [Candidatus Nanoarchaeia archaeon]